VPGLINLDFADVRAVMKEAGSALMGIGRGAGEGRAAAAAREAIASPLLEVNIAGAQGVLFNITGGSNLSLFEVDEAAEIVKETADPEANIIFGTVIDERMGDEISITVIATGFDSTRKRETGRVHQSVGMETGAAVRASRENRDYLRELDTQRQAATIPVQPEQPPAQPQALMADRPRPVERLEGGRRGPQVEVEDLDIPAFLRRGR